MSLDPKLGGLERGGSLLCGVGAVVYALMGNFDHAWVRGLIVIIGLALVVGGSWGT